MKKSVLIIDSPEECAKCPCSYIDTHGDRCCRVKKKFIDDGHGGPPVWCPLIPLPEKMQIYGTYRKGDMPASYKIGWNACIEALEGGKQ